MVCLSSNHRCSSDFTVPFSTFHVGFLNCLSPCFPWGISAFQLGLSHCLLNPLVASCSYSLLRRLQSFWQSTSTLQQAARFEGGLFLRACWESWTALSWYHCLQRFCTAPLGPAVRKRRWRVTHFFFCSIPAAFCFRQRSSHHTSAFPSRDSAKALQTTHSAWVEKSHSSLVLVIKAI